MSATIGTFGVLKGSIFSICSMLLQNIIFIPAILVLASSGIHLFRKVIKDKDRKNIKSEILKHTITTIIIFLVLCIASVIKVFISMNLLIGYIAINRINKGFLKNTSTKIKKILKKVFTIKCYFDITYIAYVNKL